MLQSISIQNFQSLHDIEVDLSRFTVIVGPSSSGKSAFTRALHTLVNNRRGLSFLTHGERLMTITARTERGTTILRRGKGTSDNDYTVIPTGKPTGQQKWTKLNANVPEEVSAFLGLYPGGGSFAAQHDMPYLLADGPSSVAGTLGKLTNVSVIFDAARESKRQALDASKTLRLRSEDLATITSSMDRFEHIEGQQQALTDAEKKISTAYQIMTDLQAIERARDGLIAAAGAVKRMRAAADITAPDVQPALDAYAALRGLTSARDAFIAAAQDVRAAQQRVAAADEEQQAVAADRAAFRSSTADIFRERFEQAADGADANYIHTDTAAEIAARTVEEISA